MTFWHPQLASSGSEWDGLYMHESKTTEGLTLQWAGRKPTVLRALRVAREPEAVTHWERLLKNRAFSKAHRNFCREILPLETGKGTHLTFPIGEQIQ